MTANPETPEPVARPEAQPIVAIVGRPNVGKSSLFNRLTRSRDALVDDLPGVTRDRIHGEAVWDDRAFLLVDTGGFTDTDPDGFAGAIRRQIEQALSAADAVIMVLDGRSGPSPFDREIIDRLRSLPRPVLFAVNKIDGPEVEDRLFEFYGLGIDHPHPVSAAHGYGINDLMDNLAAALPPAAPAGPSDRIHLAVAGRPNVGKSSLINRLLGEERLMVGDLPGTTRDAVDIALTKDGTDYLLMDTAGIRRKGRVVDRLEKFSIIKALKSLERCDVALLVMDASEGITAQDLSVAGYAHDRGRGCLVLLNKWDLVARDERRRRRITEQLRSDVRFLSFAPTLRISALTGQRVGRILPAVGEIYSQYTARTGTGPLNRLLEEAVARTEPPLHRGRRLKFYYATQVSTRPPTIVVFVSHPEAVHFSYRRYLTNQFREGLGLDRTPVRLILRQRGADNRKPRGRKGRR